MTVLSRGGRTYKSSPESGSKNTMVLPAFTGRLAQRTATTAAAPEDMPDIVLRAGRVIIMVTRELKRFDERASYISSPGCLEGGNAGNAMALSAEARRRLFESIADDAPIDPDRAHFH